jgi:hypothetical protein
MPLARPMPTEVRSDGGLNVKLLQAPHWAAPGGHPLIATWVCALPLMELVELRRFLVRPDPETGIQPEAAIDAAMKALGIGSYVGTFVSAGPNLSEVRFMFGFAPKTTKWGGDQASINLMMFDLLQDKNNRHPQASRDLRRLRNIWNGAPVRSDGTLMMLSQIDLVGQLSDPRLSPYSADFLEREGRKRGASL